MPAGTNYLQELQYDDAGKLKDTKMMINQERKKDSFIEHYKNL